MDGPGTWEWVRRRLRRAASWALCRVGRHLYAVRRNPEVSGPLAVYHECRRCGHERTVWDRPARGQYLGIPERRS